MVLPHLWDRGGLPAPLIPLPGRVLLLVAGDRFVVGMGAARPGAARAPGTGLGPFLSVIALPSPAAGLVHSVLLQALPLRRASCPSLGLEGFSFYLP